MSSLPRAHFSQLNNEAKTRKIRLQDDVIMISDLFSLVKHDVPVTILREHVANIKLIAIIGWYLFWFLTGFS